MPLGPEKWARCCHYYEKLTLADGDEVEQLADSEFQLGTLFPSYTRFWKFHVCPATVRPNGIVFRKNMTAAIICTIAQRSYAVMDDLVKAHEDLAFVKAGDLGRNERNAEQVLLYAGNALQKAYDLKVAISTSRSGEFQGMSTLADTLGVSLDPFPDWATSWAEDRSQTATYRHYLTHQGKMFRVYRGRKVFVPSRKMFENRQVVTWTQHEQNFDNDPEDWVDIVLACEEVVRDTIAFLNLAYERLCDAFDPLLPNRNYQHLWGWRDGVDPLASPRPFSPAKIGFIISHPGSGSRAIADLPIHPDDRPGGSGALYT